MNISNQLTSKQVRDMLGGISDMSLWRFLHDKHLNFPKPIYINRRRFWSSKELSEWFQKQPRAYRKIQ